MLKLWSGNMKYIKTLILAVSILIIVVPINVIAADQTGFQTSAVSEDEIKSLIKDFDVILLTDEPNKRTINCFDVNENGLVAIGSQSQENCNISIYNSDLKFLYGLSFECAGSYYIEWNNENLNIYYVRDNIAVSYNSNAEITNIEKIDDTMENNSYWYVLKKTERQIGDVRYKIQNNLGALNFFIGQSSYSQLVKIDESGAENILYDVNNEQKSECIFSLLFLLVFIILLTSIIILSVRKNKKS